MEAPASAKRSAGIIQDQNASLLAKRPKPDEHITPGAPGAPGMQPTRIPMIDLTSDNSDDEEGSTPKTSTSSSPVETLKNKKQNITDRGPQNAFEQSIVLSDNDEDYDNDSNADVNANKNNGNPSNNRAKGDKQADIDDDDDIVITGYREVNRGVPTAQRHESLIPVPGAHFQHQQTSSPSAPPLRYSSVLGPIQPPTEVPITELQFQSFSGEIERFLNKYKAAGMAELQKRADKFVRENAPYYFSLSIKQQRYASAVIRGQLCRIVDLEQELVKSQAAISGQPQQNSQEYVLKLHWESFKNLLDTRQKEIQSQSILLNKNIVEREKLQRSGLDANNPRILSVSAIIEDISNKMAALRQEIASLGKRELETRRLYLDYVNLVKPSQSEQLLKKREFLKLQGKHNTETKKLANLGAYFRRNFTLNSNSTPTFTNYYNSDNFNNFENNVSSTVYSNLIEDDDEVVQEINALDFNIYAGQKSEDLRLLLESIKTTEEEIEGESLTPDQMTVNLLPHQRKGLKWLETIENDKKKKGGILADDMGFGKTVQTIALMLSNRSKNNEHKTNLIVCPLALMNQWEQEMKTKIKEVANFSVLIYHGSSVAAKGIKTFKQLSKYDAVIVTFNTLSQEIKKHCAEDIKKLGKLNGVPNLRKVNQTKGPNEYISPFFSEDSKFYRIIIDEAHIIKNKNAQMSIACASLLSEYKLCLTGTPMQNGIQELFPLIRFLQIKPYSDESNYKTDILLPLKSKSDGYDDRDRKQALRRVQVLLKAIMFRRDKKSVDEKGEPILKLPKKHINIKTISLPSNKEEEEFYYSLESNSKSKVRSLLDSQKLSKGSYSSILTLLLRLRQACLHSQLVKVGELKKDAGADEDDGEGDDSDDGDRIEKLYSIVKKLDTNVINRINSQEFESFTCLVCTDSTPKEDWKIFTPCGHGLCKDCVEEYFERFRENESLTLSKCPSCRRVVNKLEMVSFNMFDNIINKGQSLLSYKIENKQMKKKKNDFNLIVDKTLKTIKLSPKFNEALELIMSIRKEHPDEKIILFSQFTLLFKLFGKFLTDRNIKYLLFEGNMKPNERHDVLQKFHNDDSFPVILISLKAGNVGLTLTRANHVILMDPFWNPYVEDQAQDRAHRIGQNREVQIYRLLNKDTVEDRIIQLQEKKKELIEGAMDADGMKSVAGLGRQELGFLFGLNKM